MAEQFIERINVYLTDEQKKKLVSIGKIEGSTLSALIRNFVIKGIKNYEGGD